MPTSKRNGKRIPLSEALRSDFPASIIVFLVALPLCMGIAIASGAPPATGLITGIVGGLLVGWIAGSPLQVSGPAAGLFVLVAQIVDKYSVGPTTEAALERGLAAMGLAVLGAGLIQLAAGLLKFGNVFRAVSPAVIQGMLSGIGVLILASQFHVMVDDKDAAKPYLEQGYPKGIANLVTIPQSLWLGVVPLDGSPHHLAAAIGVGTILVLVFWKMIPKNPLRIVPAPVIAVTLASIVAYSLSLTLPPDKLEALEDKKGIPEEGRVRITQVEVPSNLASEIRIPFFWQPPSESGDGGPEEVAEETTDEDAKPASDKSKIAASDPPDVGFTSLLTTSLLVSALTIALVASAETMLCATAVDQMQTHARTNYDKELTAQGVGNLVCGLLGALPMTGVIVRSSANVDAGGRTRYSTILHGLWLLVFVAILPWVLNYIPMAALAAVLVFTGWKLINIKAIYKLWKVSVAEGIICLITLVLVVGVDLLSGVIAGIVCTAARLLWLFSRLDVEVDRDETSHRVELHLHGAATFLALPRLTAILDDIEPETELHVHLEELQFVDHACLELFVNWEKQHAASGGKLVMDWDNLTAVFRNTGTKTYKAASGNDRANAGSIESSV